MMEEYQDPKHRLLFYEEMKKRIPRLRSIYDSKPIGLCLIIEDVSIYALPFKSETGMPMMDEALPELWEQRPPRSDWDGNYWWYKYDLISRENAIDNAITEVKKLIID